MPVLVWEMEDLMTWSHSTLAAAAISALVGTLTMHPAAAQRAERVKAGVLSCDISGGLGLIIASRKEVTCLFTPSGPGPREVYVGAITKFGLDIGATAGGRMEWAVYAPTTRRIGALAGSYAGAGAQATVGVGAGVNVLVGGSDRTVSLQPISFEGQAGLNVAGGVTELVLRPAR
jgi:hypothetical protein